MAPTSRFFSFSSSSAGKTRRAEDLGERVEQQVGVARERRRRRRPRRPGRSASDEKDRLAARLSRSSASCELRAARGALHQLARRHRRDQAPVLGRVEPPGLERAREGDRRIEPVLEDEEARAVGERALAHGLGERQRAGGARRAPVTTAVSAPSSGTAALSAGAFGRYRPTVRRVVVEVRQHDPLDVGRRDAADRGRVVGVPLPVRDGDGFRERRRDLVGRVAVEDDLGLDLGPRLLALGRGDRLGRDAGDLLPDHVLDLRRLDAGAHRARRPRRAPGRAAARARRSPRGRGSSRRAPGGGAT